MTQHLPHAPYITAIEAALTLTPETSGIPAARYPHGLLLVWDWHTGLDEDYDRGAAWQWARLRENGCQYPYEPLPVPGWVAPAMLAATAAVLALTGTPAPMRSLWHAHLRGTAVTACETWGATQTA
jgi:hypothetical protein